MENRQEFEKRMAAEYEAYASAQKNNGHFVLSYGNWLASRKAVETAKAQEAQG